MSAATGRLPVWERLRAPDRRPLTVLAVRQIELDEAHVDDGDLREAGGATVFDAWPDGDGYVLRAARIEEATAHTIVAYVRRLRIEAGDGRLEALLGEPGTVGTEGELERLACACRGVSADAVYRAMANGWQTVEQLKRATRVAFGVCQGRRCVPWLAERLGLPLSDPRAAITPRPPLVPVPASVLAAYADAPLSSPTVPQPGPPARPR